MNRNKIIALSVGAFIISTGLATFSLLNFKTGKQTQNTEVTKEVPATTTQTNQNIVENTDLPGYINGIFVPTSTLLEGEDVSSSSIKYTELPKDLFIENFSWQEPKEVNKLGVVVQSYKACVSDGMFDECPLFSEEKSTYYRVANFSYHQQNGEIILLSSYGQHYFVVFKEKITLLEKNRVDNWGGIDGFNKLKFSIDKNLSLPKNINIPKELNVPGKQKLYFEEEIGITLFGLNDGSGGIDREKIAYFDNKDIWNYGDFFVTFTNNIDGIQPLKYNIKLPTIFNLDNGKKENVSDYDSKRDIGCGRHEGVKVIADIKENDLEKIGKADDGNLIFRYKVLSGESESDSLYTNYNGYMEATGNSTTTYEKFISENPTIIMKDGFGRYIEFIKYKFLVNLAECGKPVIYLYPKTETKINVQVKPNGGLTKVDPFYPSDGWLVKAKPNGELTNLSDKQQYPYLFWEGNAYNMEVPSDGFVLKKENIKRDMTKLLTRLGLNEKETTDFLEFWQSKLEEKPYVFVTFVSQTNFDKVAPLNIYPRPDKVIRVFMDYQPLNLPIAVRPLKIETPVRTGFTVVEWGGRLHQ